jgi:hypothetical protein
MPWRDADDPLAWDELSSDENYDAWTAVYEAFDFNPTMNSAEWPSFREPVGSITWSLRPMFTRAGTEAEFMASERDVATCLLSGLVLAKGNDDHVHALDWQHPGIRFDPTLARPPEHIDSWLVPSLPNGDYYLFVAHDMRFGWLSHPSECSVCVYGDLLPTIREAAARFDWPLLRQN